MKLCECGCGQEVISEKNRFLLGHNNKGKKLGPCSEDRRKKIRLAALSRLPDTEETRKKKRVSHLGKSSGMLGKQHSDSSKMKNSLANTGKLVTKETRKKRSESVLKAHADPTKYKDVAFGYTRGTFFSVKNGKAIPYKSSSELQYLKWLESNPDVVNYEYEPVRIPYLFEGRQHTTRPDFLVHYTDGHTELVEVKMEWRLSDLQEQVKIQIMKKYAEETNCLFRLILGKDLDTLDSRSS